MKNLILFIITSVFIMTGISKAQEVSAPTLSYAMIG